LTAVFVEDPESGGYTAFFSHIPGVVAEGKTLEEATKNLGSALEVMKKFELEDS